MFTPSLAGAADVALSTLRAIRARSVNANTSTLEVSPEPAITDDANWLDLDREEQIAFDEKLSAFLDLDVENKEREWLLPNGHHQS